MNAPRPLAAVLAAGALAGMPAPASARTIDVRTQPRIEIVGATPRDFAGLAVAPAGDVNGDGIDDVIVGAPGAGVHGRHHGGAAYVVFGRRRPRDRSHASRVRVRMDSPAAGFRIVGPHADALVGEGVASAGDVNGDGRADVLIGGESVAYIVFGKADGATIDLAHLGRAGVRIVDARKRRIRQWVAGGRDVNGDGRPDVVLTDERRPAPFVPGVLPGQPQENAYVVFGGLHTTRLDLSHLGRHGFAIQGTHVDGVAMAADMTGDHRAEVVLQTGPVDAEPLRATVVFGHAGPKPVDLSDLGSHGFVVDQRSVFGGEGAMTIGAGGDVNGDGRGDLVVGSVWNHDAAETLLPPMASVIFGAPSSEPVWMDLPGPRVLTVSTGPLGPGDVDTRGPVPTPRTMIGQAVSIVGDVNGDGLADVLVGGASGQGPRPYAGQAYLILGRRQPGTVLVSHLGPRDLELEGPEARDGFGTTTAAAGDFDGDGHPDLLIAGASATRKGRTDAGVAWILTDLPLR